MTFPNDFDASPPPSGEVGARQRREESNERSKTMKTKSILLSGVIALLACATSQAQDATWINSGSGAWTDNASWSSGAAPSNNNVFISNNGTKTVTIAAATPVGNLTIGNLTVTSGLNTPNTLLLNNTNPLTVNGTLAVSGLFNGGAASVAKLLVDGGNLNTTSNMVTVGKNSAYGNATVSNGTWLAKEITVWGVTGQLNVLGGNLTMSTAVSGWGIQGPGSVLVSGTGVITDNFNTMGVKTLVVNNGGTLNLKAVNVGDSTGVVASSTANMTIDNGNVNTSAGLLIGRQAGTTGTVVMTGGNLTITNGNSTAQLKVGELGNGTFTLNAGKVTADILTVANGANSTFTFNGGTLSTRTTTINNTSVFTVGNGTAAAGLTLNGGSHSFANGITLANNATLSGNGTITTGTLIVSSGATLSPGNSPGTLTAGATTLEGGGNYNWQILDATAAAGTGFDTISLTAGNALTLNNSIGNKFNINLWSLSSIGPDVNGDAGNFNNATNYSWTLISTSLAITGFDANSFAINVSAFNGTGGFSNAINGSFTISLGDSGTDLMLNYTAIPEPAAWVLAALSLTVIMILFHRRQAGVIVVNAK